MLCWTVHLKDDENRYQYGAAVAVGNELYHFGGEAQLIDVKVFNTVALLWRKLPPGRGQRPSRRYFTAVLVGDIVYIWGGWTNAGLCNELYAYDVDAHTWSKPRGSGTFPEGRRDHSACVLGKVMFIHGGETQTGYTNDIYKLDTSTMVWTSVHTRGSAPPVTSGHSSTFIGTKMFVYGGIEDEYYSNNTLCVRVFDTETNQWLDTPTQPIKEERWVRSAFTDNGELYIFGEMYMFMGLFEGADQDINYLWKYYPETFSWKEVKTKGNGPSSMTTPCPDRHYTCCSVGDHIILFGGVDMFILDLSPSLKVLCKLAVIQYDLEQSDLPHNIRWELVAMTSKN